MGERRRFAASMALLGFAATLSQVLLVRMLLMAFKGNEFGIGLLFGLWLLASALGAWLAEFKEPSERTVWLGVSLMAAILPIELVLASMPRALFGLLPGNALSLWQITALSMLSMWPTAFLSGFVYVLGCKALSRAKAGVALGYLFEALGATVAGTAFTFVMAGRMLPLQISAMLLVLVVLALATVFTAKFLPLLAIPAIALLFADSVERWSLEKQWKGYEIKEFTESPYGRTVVSAKGSEYYLFHNGNLLTSWPYPNYEHIEPLVHMAMNAHGLMPENVLLFGGGTPAIDEILKYPVKKLVYTELDPKLVDVFKRYTYFPKDNRLIVALTDGRKFLKETDMEFDIVLIDLPPPLTLEINRFYTTDFFKLVRKHLKNDGIVSLTLPFSVSYAAEETRRMDAAVIRSLETVFDTVLSLKNGELLVIAGDTIPPKAEIIGRFEMNGVQTYFVSSPYIDYRMDMVTDLDELIGNRTVMSNTDWRPIATYYGMSYWSLIFSPKLRKVLEALIGIRWWHVVIVALIVATISGMLWRLRGSVSFAITTTGFAGMAFDTIPIILFQMLWGYVYKTIGLIVAGFHAGLALGGLLSYKILKKGGRTTVYRAIIIDELLIIAMSLSIFGLIKLGLWGVSVTAFLGGALVGFEFPIAVELLRGGIGKLYASDLIGGLVSAVVLTPIFIPIMGLKLTLLILGSFKAISLTSILLTSRR